MSVLFPIVAGWIIVTLLAVLFIIANLQFDDTTPTDNPTGPATGAQ